MVVHGDDFIIAGSCDDFDWSSKKLNEKLELVQRAILGPGYDSEAAVLNRCVTYSESGMTWGPATREWQCLDSSRRAHRRAQVTPSRTHH